MKGPFPRLYLYWVLLFLPTLGVGVGAFLLLSREEGRLLARAEQLEEGRRTALGARAQLAAENAELIISDLETGLLDTLAAAPAENPDAYLRSLQQANPLVRSTFRCAPDGTLLRPLAGGGDEESRGFHRRFSQPLREAAAARFRRSVSLDTAFQVPALPPPPAARPVLRDEPSAALVTAPTSAPAPTSPGDRKEDRPTAHASEPAGKSRNGLLEQARLQEPKASNQAVERDAAGTAGTSAQPVQDEEVISLSPFMVEASERSSSSNRSSRNSQASSQESAPELNNYAANVQRARRDVQSLAKLRPAPAQSSSSSRSKAARKEAPSASASSSYVASDTLASRDSAAVSKDLIPGAAARQSERSSPALAAFSATAPAAAAGPGSSVLPEGSDKESSSAAPARKAEQAAAPAPLSLRELPPVPATFSREQGQPAPSLELPRDLRRSARAQASPRPSPQAVTHTGSTPVALASDGSPVSVVTAPVERRGWLPQVIDNHLFLLGWVQPAEDAQVRGVEVELTALVSRLGAALPPDLAPGEGLCLRDERGRVFHQAGTLPFLEVSGNATSHRNPDFIARVPLATPLLPGWSVEAYLLPSAGISAGESSGFLLTGSLLAGTLVVALLSGGLLLLLQARASAQEAVQKTSFVANVSHELKTPLTTIRLYSDLLEQGRVANAERRAEYLRTIGRESERLSRLVNNVLDFSRLERGLRSLSNEALDPAAELRRICEVNTPRLADAGLRLDLVLPDSPVTVLADRDAFGQILLNLLDNALKYAAGGGELRVSLEQGQAGRLLVRVADRGPGVEASERERIFLKFHRVDQSLTAEKGGAGLGLSIARQLARAMGGELRCLPREGGGAIFELSLPPHAKKPSA